VTTIFDIGMFDGADTDYYLDSGHRVIAVEANPELVQAATVRFAGQIASGQLTCIHAALAERSGPIELYLSRSDLGSSSLFSQRVAHKTPAGSITVPGLSLADLTDAHGVPDYLKIDIEGADRICVLSLSATLRPKFVSFEIGDDLDELLGHLEGIGYKRFKVINQSSFRELANQTCLTDRAAHWLMRQLGYRDPRLIRRAGRFFVRGHSSGPVPWESDGRWYSLEATQARVRAAIAANDFQNWYDIHAMVD
jgi:FkbM family methyltransferase